MNSREIFNGHTSVGKFFNIVKTKVVLRKNISREANKTDTKNSALTFSGEYLRTSFWFNNNFWNAGVIWELI